LRQCYSPHLDSVSKCIDSEISPSKLDGFKGIESEYVSLA
jgi:hypothetical protein